MVSGKARKIALFITPLVFGAGRLLLAAPTITPAFQNYYSITADLGQYPLYPFGGNYSGLCFLPTDSNTLLISAQVTESSRGIVPATVARNATGHIVGFSGITGHELYPAPHIDSGLAFGPNNVLFATAYPDNLLYEYNPGTVANTITKTVNIGALGVSFSVGSVAFVPPGYPGAGGIRFNSAIYGQMYKADLTPDGNGTFNVSNVTELMTFGGDNNPEQMIWVLHNAPGFNSANNFVLVNHFGSSQVAAYQLDASGTPIFSTQKTFISGFVGVEGGAIDPVTGDFLFSTYGAFSGGDHIYVVSRIGGSGVAGDYNGNGVVDASDYVSWRNNSGTSNVLPNDPIGGTVGVAQYNQWRAHFGQSAGSSLSSEAENVPEPSAMLLSVGGIGHVPYPAAFSRFWSLREGVRIE